MKQRNLIFLPKGNWARMLFSLVLLMVLMTGMAFAQQKTITGKVLDESGASIPGVSVLVKGTTVGTVTDIDGKYSLNAPSNSATLNFGFVGMISQDVAIGQKTVINVTMKTEVVGVDEVVVVGYGTRKKEELTGAISTVSDKQLKTSTASSVMTRLQGQVSGVNVTTSNRPGGEPTIRIRGVGTINDSNPLYVIDGVPVGPGNNINPNDIESISILKDASSTAIYGARGANGVVIITTKRGKKNQEPSVTFSVKTGIQQATNQYNMLNTKEYGEALWLAYKNNGTTPNHLQYGNGTTPVIPDYIKPAGAKEGSAGVNPNLYSYPDYQIYKANKNGTNWYDEIYRTGKIQEYDLAVAGGGEKSTYSFSGNYYDEEGILNNTDFKRYTFRINSDAKFNDWFKAGESLQAIYINQHGNLDDNGEGTPISQAYRAQPIIPVYDIMGKYAGSSAKEMGNAENPVAQLDRAKNNQGQWVRVMGSLFAEAYLMEGLTAKSLLGFNFGQWNYKGYVLPNFEHSEPNKVNGLNVDSNYELQWNWSNTLHYNKTFAEVHNLDVIIGAEAIQNKDQKMSASRRQYFSENPDYMQLDAGELNKENGGNGSEWSMFSTFGRFDYNYKSKYFLEGTVRRDGSSRFSKANRYGVFPAAAAAWTVSEENFMAQTKTWLSYLKLRAGWGVSGNDRVGNYNSYTTFASNSYTAAYAIDGSNTSAVVGFRPSALGNENVSWETTKTINLGVDASLFDKKLTMALDLWDRKTSDMLYPLPIPNVSGVLGAPSINIGEMKNKGIDLQLGYNNSLMSGQFKYSVNLTMSKYVNEIVRISNDETLKIEAGSLRQMNYTRFTKGSAYPEFFGYIVDGIFQTDAEAAAYFPYGTTTYNKAGHFKFRDVNGDKKITPDDRTFIGSPHPDFTGGLSIDLSYKNFDLNMFFYGSYGNKIVNYVTRWIDYGMFNGGLSRKALYESWGSPYLANKADAKLPMLDQNDISQQPSTAFLEDGSFLRMKSLRLGYTVPSSVLSKVQIKSLRFYVQATNLFTMTKYGGLDPELNSSGDSMGLDQGAWPTPRQIMFGLTLGL